jgi:excinuclease ABC subunit A
MSEKKNKKEIQEDKIIVKGARTHNLKNITVEMPRGKMVVFTGLSGSGKSSLAFDTIFAEGQRRYVESLSAYARQFLHQMQKPDVDEIVGLSPAISIDQKSRSNNPRSTVATITEIYDYLRIMYARIGRPHCLICGREIQKLSNEEIKNFIYEKIKDEKVLHDKSNKDKKIKLPIYLEIFSPVVRGRKGEYYQLLYDLLGKGYSEILVDKERKNLRERIVLSKNNRHDISVLVDSISLSEFESDEKTSDERLSEAIEKSIQESEGLVVIRFRDMAEEHLPAQAGKPLKQRAETKEFLMSAKWSCPHDGFSFPEIEPRLFSFNSPYGACPECNGLGTKYFFGNEACPKCKV